MRGIIGGMLCFVLVLTSACGGDGSGDNDTIPSAPGNVSVMAGRGHIDGQTGNYALIRWDTVSGADSYTLYYGASDSINTSSSHVSGVTSPYAFTNNNVRTGAYYYFALTAVNNAGESDLSEIKRMAVLIPQTGQTTSYADNDDGDLEEGAAWPSTRFLDNGDQTVTDTLTGLMWMQTPTTIPSATWDTAYNLIASYNSATGGHWRLPNRRELLSLVDFSQHDQAVTGSPYFSIQSTGTTYWTSTYDSATTTNAWCIDIASGAASVASRGNTYRVWAVCDDYGSATAEIARTGQIATLTGYDDGYFDNGVIWPGTRFVDNGDGTVTDILTGLMWLQDADSIAAGSWASALSAVAALSTGDHHDWRLPNVRELESLLDLSQDSPCLPAEYATKFTGVQNDLYWTSTTYAGATGSAWCIDLSDGAVLTADNSISHYVLPVRSTR